MRKHTEDTQCQWCGEYEVMECTACGHAECDGCGAGGYCDCVHTSKCVCTDEPPYQECSEHNGY